jgi:hypothetical protein
MRHAIHHLERAEALFSVDVPMAVFRCYTAEEEAASGIFRCLQELGYPNAQLLNPKSHKHKNALIGFVRVLRAHFEKTAAPAGVRLSLATFLEEGAPKLRLGIELEAEGEVLASIWPEPPLGITVKPYGGQPIYTLEAQEFVSSQGAASIAKYVQVQANARNRLLYAAPQGYPKSIEIEHAKFFPAMQARVLALVRAYLLIAPYKQHQAYVQHALDAFLAIMLQLPADEPDVNSANDVPTQS